MDKEEIKDRAITIFLGSGLLLSGLLTTTFGIGMADALYEHYSDEATDSSRLGPLLVLGPAAALLLGGGLYFGVRGLVAILHPSKADL